MVRLVHKEVAGYLDVETTGLSPHEHEVIELALVLFTYNRNTGEIIEIVDEYVGLREPGRNIPYHSTSIHGLTMEDVRGHKLDHLKIEEMLSRTDLLIAHNASFDRSFLTRLFPETGEKQWLCSARGIKWKQKGFGSAKLQELLRCHGIKPKRAHRASEDVLCAINLLSMKNTDGKTYFSELIGSVS
jgi:DNA polymerase III subunit epsilon